MFKKLNAEELRHRIDRAFAKLYALDQPVPAPVVIRSGLAVKPLPFDYRSCDLERKMREACALMQLHNVDIKTYFRLMPPPKFIEGDING